MTMRYSDIYIFEVNNYAPPNNIFLGLVVLFLMKNVLILVSEF